MSRNEVTRFDPGTPAAGIVGVGSVDKQTGGNGQYARVEVAVRPRADAAPDAANVVTSAVIGGAIPSEFLPSVVAGVQEALRRGPLGGHPVSGVAVTITGGKAHVKDSNAQAFQEAGRLAARDALEKADAALLEPMATLTVSTPGAFVGAVIGDLNRRRGRVLDTRAVGEVHTIEARVPLAETFGYATHLRSLTQGRAGFVLEPGGYAEVPASVARAVAERRAGAGNAPRG